VNASVRYKIVLGDVFFKLDVVIPPRHSV
jgi:hypothetical protein